MLADLLLPAATNLHLLEVQAAPTALTLVVATAASQVPCPLCQEVTARCHSHYQRTLADLPCATFAVRVHLSTRRFFCPNPACPRRIFTERLPGFAAPSARQTLRLRALWQQLGLVLGGEAGTRLSQTLAVLTSPRTLLRLVRQVPDPLSTPPLHVGIDDFAFRKGHTYGTILVNHDSGQVIDLLPDRHAESVATWFQEHPTVEIITRDRAAVYADGATQGAPQATQVADRWHLLKNLSETLDEVLTRVYPELCAALAPAGDPPPVSVTAGAPGGEVALATPSAAEMDVGVHTPARVAAAPSEPAAPAPPRSYNAQLQQQRRAQRVALYEDIRGRHTAGQSLSQIGRDLGLDQRTVSKYARAETFPERQARTGSDSQLDRYRAYLQDRWAAGCHNRARLWREVQERGYTGSYESVYSFVTALYGKTGQADGAAAATPRQPPVRRREWVQRLGRPAAELTAEERQEVEQVCARSAVLGRVYEFAQRFGRMVREQARERFDAWLEEAIASGVAELAGFARGLQRDYAAVAAALALPWSNGPTEGHVNRLKVVKRQMYGRAKFDLLRKRVLCAA